ncbi:MAG: MoaD/ThiS family protein [Planctomycetaceae bacterium]|nr:MoaD/ThiS family protein [Planctomycetaceae bacterium]
MHIRVSYAAQARVAAGCDRQVLAIPAGATVFELLQVLAENGPTDLSGFLFRQRDQVQPTLLILCNDAPVSRRDLRTRVLQDQDEITIVPPLAGG